CMDRISCAISRAIVWIAVGPNASAYKRTTAIVTWADRSGNHSVRQDAEVYPGGLGPYSGATTTSTSTTIACTVDPPSGLTAVPDASYPSSRIDLSWAAGGNAPTTWEVQHALDAAFTQITVDTTTQPGSTTTYVKSGVAPSTTLYFRVRALGCGTSSAWSNTASATTSAATPPACTAGTANVSPTAFYQSQGSHNYLDNN